MMISRSILLIVLFILQNSMVYAMEQDFMDLSHEQWELSRHGEKVLALAELNELIRKWSVNTHNILELRYPGGEEGEIWVQEFMNWLIALGVPSASMNAVPGSANEDIIKILLIQGKQSNE